MTLQLFPALQRIQEPSISGFLSQVPSSFMQAYDRLNCRGERQERK